MKIKEKFFLIEARRKLLFFHENQKKIIVFL